MTAPNVQAPQPQPGQFQVPPGMVILPTFGHLTMHTVSSLLKMQQFNLVRGLPNVAYEFVPGALVAKARNDAVRTLLAQPQAQWLCFIDGDMQFGEETLMRLLETAFHTHAYMDVVGGYCNLRGGPALPTIDSGTGTWESWFPGSGVVEVMRTGGACLLIKRHVFERIPQPWFALRVPKRPIDAMYELDNFARIKFDGKNPWRGSPERWWEKLEQCALQDPSVTNFTPAEVGEDSGFCDAVRAAGMRICVNTDVALGHVDTKVITWEDHKKAIDDNDRMASLICGVEP